MLEGLLIADFNGDNLVNLMEVDKTLPAVRFHKSPYEEALAVLVDDQAACWQKDYGFIFIWTRPEMACPSFRNALNFENIPLDEVLSDVDRFCMLVKNVAARQKQVFLSTWMIPSFYRGYGVLDIRDPMGLRNKLMQMNMRLVHELGGVSNIFLLDVQRWVELTGKDAFNQKLWYMAKIPFGQAVFMEALADIKSTLKVVSGGAKKLIIVDLDDTLWGGIVGEVGWRNLRVGGHDPVGEAFVDFQAALKSLINKGFLLAIVSKNDESTALEAIRSIPEMILKEEDFVGWRINWEDKAQNILELVSELNLGLDSLVFIDDNHLERDRIKKALPEIYVPELPDNKLLLKSTLLSLRCFDGVMLSQEDVQRTRMYQEDRKRKDLMKEVGSLEDWFKTLDIRVTCEPLNDVNLQRAAQLFNKTNQMNLSTRRMTEMELMDWAKQQGHSMWVFRVSDKVGDSGLVGIISVEESQKRIVDFILSCRVMGKGIEKTMIAKACRYFNSVGISGPLTVEYIPTEKNKPCLEFWKNSQFVYGAGGQTFSWDLSNAYPIPEHIQFIEQ